MLKRLKSSGIPEEQLYGLDLSKEMIKQAKNGLMSSHLFVCPVEDFIPNKKFSIIVFTASLHHIRDKKSAIEKLHGVLDDGGFIYIAEPSSRWVISNNAFLFTLLRLFNPFYVYFRIKNRKKIKQLRDAGQSIGPHLYHDDVSLGQLKEIVGDLDFDYKSFSTHSLFSRLFAGVCIDNKSRPTTSDKSFAIIVDLLDHYVFSKLVKNRGGTIRAVLRKPLSTR